MGQQIPFTLSPTESSRRMVIEIGGEYCIRNIGSAYFCVVTWKPGTNTDWSHTVDAGCMMDLQIHPDIAGIVVLNPLKMPVTGWYEYVGPGRISSR